ncbi:MAG: hypothetical protein AB9907_07765 [Flexilinea sp.]
MNELLGKPIWAAVVDAAGNPSVYYYDKTKNQMVTLPGTYEQHKDVIDQNALDVIVSVQTEADTGNL